MTTGFDRRARHDATARVWGFAPAAFHPIARLRLSLQWDVFRHDLHLRSRLSVGEVNRGVMRLNEVGRVVASAWSEIATHAPGVVLDAWVVMPDHLHGIITMTGRRETRVGIPLLVWRSKTRPNDGHTRSPIPGPESASLGAIVGSFNSSATRRINVLRGVPGMRVWQRGYHERLVGDRVALNQIRRYISENPVRWSARGGGENPHSDR